MDNIINQNSPTITLDLSTSRFSGAEWVRTINLSKIVLAGVGGIGSYVAFLLARLKPYTLHIYDDDFVDEGNLSGQLYSREQVGQRKVTAIYEICNKFGNFRNVYTHEHKYAGASYTAPIMICGFDNMAARQIFFDNWVHSLPSDPEEAKKYLFIDGRLAMEEFQILAFTGDNDAAITKYREEWLFSDAEAEATVCSRKQTSFTASMIASFMVNILVNHATNISNPIVPRDIPFLTRYDASFIYLKTENV